MYFPISNAAVVEDAPLVDRQGRVITKLRVSVTDRCNFRCTYCVPGSPVDFIPENELLSFQEITRLVSIFSRMGIRQVRLTGGEPLMRDNIEELVRMVSGVESIEDVAMTTNAFFLKERAHALKAAGLKRINVGLNTLNRRKFLSISRYDGLDQVLEGLDAAACVGFESIKINAVLVRDFSEDEILPLIDWGRERDFEIRFIERMPLNFREQREREKALSGAEALEIIRRKHRLIPIRKPACQDPATLFRFADGSDRMGIIAPLSEPFCSTCSRIRLTSDGKLLSCLFAREEANLGEKLRTGAADKDLVESIRQNIRNKAPGHKLNHPGLERCHRPMRRIGG